MPDSHLQIKKKRQVNVPDAPEQNFCDRAKIGRYDRQIITIYILKHKDGEVLTLNKNV